MIMTKQMTMTNNTKTQKPKVAIIGAGASGLMTASFLTHHFIDVCVYEQMPTAGRKILWAGKTGLNVSHNESIDEFVARYTPQDWLAPYVRGFGANEIRVFMADLGIETYIGSSGRIFPVEMKASKFLRAWLSDLTQKGVQFFYHHQLINIHNNELEFLNKKTGETFIEKFDKIVLACGGGSYKKLGSDGYWQTWFYKDEISPLYASNVGIVCAWSDYMKEHFGNPLKNIKAWVFNKDNPMTGDVIISHYGLESGIIYALNKELRQAHNDNKACIYVDLLPDVAQSELEIKLNQFKKSKQSLQNSLRKIGLDTIKIALIRECVPKSDWQVPSLMARHIKALAVGFLGFRPMDEAISTGGGVKRTALDKFQLKSNPYVHCVGEMLDFDAPTGGYLLTACFATGRAVALDIIKELGDE